MSSTSKSKSSTSGSGASVVTGSGSGSGTGAIPTGNIPASSGSQQTNQTPGSLNDENINSQKPISDSSEKRKKKSSKNRSDGHIDLEEAHRAAEEKAEELRKQAEIALKQQEEEDRLRREDMFQPWGRVSLDTQFTPQGGNGQLDLTYGDLFHSPHFLATSKASTMTDTSVSTRITPSVSA